EAAGRPVLAVPAGAAGGAGAGGDGGTVVGLDRGADEVAAEAADAGTATPGEAGERAGLLSRTGSFLRAHWVLAALLVLAAGLRGVVFAAYHPALIFPDSVRYLQYARNFADGRWSPDGLRQSGYSILIIPA